MAETLDRRRLNRALLSRQLLLERQPGTPLEAVDHLYGMQAQAPQAPYVGLWSRLRDFDPEQLSKLLVDRAVVRLALMRGTVHLVTADHALYLRPLLWPLYERDLKTNRNFTGIDLDELAILGRKRIEEKPRTNGELRDLLSDEQPERDAAGLAAAVRSLLACVQVPPRGLWKRSGQATITTAEAWLGRPLAENPAPDDMISRYLRAYGPATVQDAQAWCGLTKLVEAFERLRPQLRVFRTEDGQELFDVPDAPLPSPDVNAPVRFLPEYDNCLRSHADRTRVLSESAKAKLATKNDSPRPTILVDGFVRATWRSEKKGKTATLTIQPFERPMSKRHTSAVTSEGLRLLRFVEPGADSHDVQVLDPL